MQLIAGELRPPTGTIFVGGEDVRRSDSWRQRVGWVPQRSVFDPAQRAVDFVADVGWLRGLDRATARQHAVNALRIIGLEDHSTTRLRAMSGGMQRRAMVAAGHCPRARCTASRRTHRRSRPTPTILTHPRTA